MRKREPRTTLVVTQSELHDMIDALAAAEACLSTAKRAYTMANNAPRAQETNEHAERYARLLRRLQEEAAILEARKKAYPEAFYAWLASKYQLTRYQLAVLDDGMKEGLFKEWETDYGEEKPG